MRRAGDFALVEELAHVLPERARLSWDAVVGRRLACQDEPAARAGARRVEEVAVARNRVDALEPPAQVASRLVVEKRRRAVAAREAALLETEQDDDVEVTRPRAPVVEDGDVTRLSRGNRTYGRTLERGDDCVGLERAAVPSGERLELVERSSGGLVRAGIRAGVVRRRRSLEAPGVAGHRADEVADGRGGLRCGPQPVERGQRCTAEPLGLLYDSLGLRDRTTAQPTLDEVHRTALEPRERRAEVAEEVAAAPVEPGETDEPEERATERGLAESGGLLDRVGNPERDEDRVERSPPAIDGVAHDADALGRGPVPEELDYLRADELDRSPGPGALEEADRAVQRDAALGCVREQLALEPDEGWRDPARQAGLGRAELLDSARCHPGKVLDRALERRIDNSSRLVRNGDRDLGAGCERLQERPLGSGQVFEAVGEDGLTGPGVELRRETLGGPPAEPVSIPVPEAVELVPIRLGQAAEIAFETTRRDEGGLDLAESCKQRVGEAVRPRRAREPFESRALDRLPHREPALRLGRHGSESRIVADDVLEEVVERPDTAGQERRTTAQEIALDALDVSAIRDYEPGIAAVVTLERGEIPLEEQRDLAGVSRPHDERERHLPMVVPASDAPSYAARRLCAKSVKLGLWAMRPRTSDAGPGAPRPVPASFPSTNRRGRPASPHGVRR